MIESHTQERRQSGRMHVEIPVSLLLSSPDATGEQSMLEAITLDCSDEGARISAYTGNLKPGSMLALRPLGAKEETVIGRIVWVQPPGANGVGQAGVHFLNGSHLHYEV
jgi:hypothetical protein